MKENKIKILVVEDDRFLIKLYGDKLKREGFLVTAALNAEEALNKLPMDKPDLIILDLVLPGKNGFEVLSELKLNSETKDIPVIVLSNLGQESDIKRAMNLGAVKYVIKTEFSVNQLAEIVKENLAASKK